MDVTGSLTSRVGFLCRSLLCLAVPATVVAGVWAMAPEKGDGNNDLVDPVTELHSAVTTRNWTAVEHALSRGASIDATEPHAGCTPLMWAARAGDLDLVRMLLDRGADVRAMTWSLGTALSNATCGNNPAVIQLLLARGADPDTGRPDGFTPLMSAASNGDVAAAQMLIRAGADVNARSQSGDTALRVALDEGNKPLAKILVAAGATPCDASTRRSSESLPLGH